MSKRIVSMVFVALAIVCAGAQDIAITEKKAITSQSTMSWETQIVRSVVSLDAKKTGITLPSGRNAALQMLEMETPSLLAETYFSIRVNSSELLGNAVEEGSVSLAKLNRIIDEGKTTPPFFSLDLKQISMTHTVELAQISSLFITHKNPYEAKEPLEPVPTRAYSGILIDARGAFPVHGEYAQARLEPCLFPRLWDGDMNLVYEKNMVNPDIARVRGIVRYTSSTDESRYRDRIGADPLRISVREVYGENHTDPVISRKDSLKVLSSPENRKLLLDGKVVILCDAEALETKGLGPEKDDNYYFTWKEIDRALSAKPVARIDFSSTWEGLKLTVYDIRFVADTAKILPEEESRLDAIADALKIAGPQARFTVAGHTASVGKPAGELALSVERAARIAEELVKRGLSHDRITSTGFGGTRPVAPNDTDEGRAKNRRVEITIELAVKPAD